MKSTGEVMAIGRTFSQAVMKAVRGCDIGRDALTGWKFASIGAASDTQPASSQSSTRSGTVRSQVAAPDRWLAHGNESRRGARSEPVTSHSLPIEHAACPECTNRSGVQSNAGEPRCPRLDRQVPRRPS